MLEKHQLTGPNFNEWLRALKLVVRTEKLQDVFETPLPPAPAASADNQALADWNALFDRHNEVACLMLGTMSPKLYQQFENKSPQEMITELQKMYGKPPGVELQELVNMFHSCKQAEGQSVSDHVLLMKSYLDQLATLNYAFPDKVSMSFILNSLSSEFQAFVQNYNMQSMEKTISEVHSLLIKFEKSIKRNKQQIVGASSTPQVMAIQSGRVQKKKPQGKAKGKEKGKGLKNSYPTKPKKPQPYKKERTDKARITRKWLKPNKHEHGNGRAHKELGECYQSQPHYKYLCLLDLELLDVELEREEFIGLYWLIYNKSELVDKLN
ncbi:hypothetical protein Tco_0074048 [Tanacetum coccineum]